MKTTISNINNLKSERSDLALRQRRPVSVPAHGAENRLRLVRAGRQDYRDVVTLFRALHAYNASLDNHFALAENWEPLLEEHFGQTYSSATSLWLLAKEGNQAVGLLIASVHADSPIFQYNRWVEIEALYVAPAHQGHGVSQRLMAQAYTWACQHGSNRIQLYVTATNVKARSFYAHEGFVVTQEIQRKLL
jgi:GNAT superfamily N-acetyltransferase